MIDDGTEEDLLAAEGIEDEEVYDDYDLAHDDLESNLLAMSNSLQIQNLNIGGSNDVVECKNKDDIEIDDSNDDDQHSGSSSGDCFGSTGLFTAMWNKKNGGKIQIYVIKKEVNPAAALSSIDDLLF